MNPNNQYSAFDIVRQYLTSRSAAIQSSLHDACLRSDITAANTHFHDLMEVARAQRAARVAAQRDESRHPFGAVSL